MQIFHISDIHFGRHHAPEAAEGVLETVSRRRPDLVVISGDLTQRAKPREFRAAREFVDRIEAETLAVPGNHDVPLYRFWERIFVPYGAYRRHFASDVEPIVRRAGVTVLGVNTAFNWTTKEGRIRNKRLRRIEETLQAEPADTFKIIVAHHQLVPAPRFDTQRVMHNALAAVETFTRSGVDLVLSGHLHQTFITSSGAYFPHSGKPFLILHAGTTTSHRGRGIERRRNTANWISFDEDSVRISHLDWDSDASKFMEKSRHAFPRRTLERTSFGEW